MKFVAAAADADALTSGSFPSGVSVCRVILAAECVSQPRQSEVLIQVSAPASLTSSWPSASSSSYSRDGSGGPPPVPFVLFHSPDGFFLMLYIKFDHFLERSFRGRGGLCQQQKSSHGKWLSRPYFCPWHRSYFPLWRPAAVSCGRQERSSPEDIVRAARTDFSQKFHSARRREYIIETGWLLTPRISTKRGSRCNEVQLLHLQKVFRILSPTIKTPLERPTMDCDTFPRSSPDTFVYAYAAQDSRVVRPSQQ